MGFVVVKRGQRSALEKGRRDRRQTGREKGVAQSGVTEGQQHQRRRREEGH